MTIRKRRMRAPGFGMPTPYNPLTGQYETLAPTGHYPYCAMMQVAEDDTHEDYVVCRGWDTRVNRFFDAVSVAKPYGKRAKYIYRIGQVYPAVLPWMRLGENWAPSQNPGVAETTQGHPADLDEEVEILYDDDSKVINWMLIDCGPSLRWFECATSGNAGSASYSVEDDDGNSFTVYPNEPAAARWGVFRAGALDYAGTMGWAQWSVSNTYWEIVTCNALESMGGVLKANCKQNEHAAVDLYWLNRSVSPTDYTQVDSGFDGIAVNFHWPCEIAIGTYVTLTYSRIDNVWLIHGVDPSAGYSSVNVVTDSDPSEVKGSLTIPCWASLT